MFYSINRIYLNTVYFFYIHLNKYIKILIRGDNDDTW